MSVGLLERQINNWTNVPYKKALFTKNGWVVQTRFFKINEPIKNSLGYYLESDEPTYRIKNIEVYVYDIKNALQLRLDNEKKTREIRDNNIEKLDFYRKAIQRVKDVTAILGDKIKYDHTIQANEQLNLKLVIKHISPEEYRAVKELESLKKITKTENKENVLEQNKTLIVTLLIVAVGGYIVGHYVLGWF
jgi:hypothetical protein